MTFRLWKAVRKSDSAAVMSWTRKRLRSCDPYLVWADASTQRPDRHDHRHLVNIALLLELNRPEDFHDLLARLNQSKHTRMIPNQLRSTYPTCFVTVLVSRAGLHALINEVIAGTIQRFVLQGARADLSSMTRILFKAFTDHPLQTVNARRLRTDQRPVRGSTYLGILDDGLPFLRVRTSVSLGGQRAHLWDQGWAYEGLSFNPDNPLGKPPDPSDPYWRLTSDSQPILVSVSPITYLEIPTDGFLYGRRTKVLEMPAKGDRDEYADSHYVHPSPRQTHGASVLGLMAPWLSTRRGLVQWDKNISGLAMVQLPTVTVDDTSGGSLAMRVLDGIRYVLWQEQQDRTSDEGPRPTVVNVSYGVHAGPHDGTSMFERAAREALCLNEHLHLVLPMGNAHRVGAHAQHRLGRKKSADDNTTLVVRVLPDNPRDTFVELWLEEDAEVDVEIAPPSDGRIYKLGPGQARMCYEEADETSGTPRVIRFAGVYPDRAANGTNGTMILIAIGATRHRFPDTSSSTVPHPFQPVGANQQRRCAVIAPSGEWQITVRNRMKGETILNAWIERDDAAPDRSVGDRQAIFPDSARPEIRTFQSTPEGTLNGVATFVHERLHVVGAMRSNGRLSHYSAARATCATPRPPDSVAVADWSPAVPGILSLGFTEGAVTRLNGTSAACAVYSRALAQQLAKDPNKLPTAPAPGFVEPEFDCSPEDEPSADDESRGEGVRQLFSFDVEIDTGR